MRVRLAKKMQKILWHSRWIVLTGIVLYNAFGIISPHHNGPLLQTNATLFAIYFLLGLFEGYFECKGSCKQSLCEK